MGVWVGLVCAMVGISRVWECVCVFFVFGWCWGNVVLVRLGKMYNCAILILWKDV